MKTRLQIIIVLLLLAANGFAQRTDTVESRWVTSRVGDSASIRYFLGSFCFEQNSAKQFLHFKNMRHHSVLGMYYQTQDFTITKSNASLSMFRFARFDGTPTLLNATSTILYIVEVCNSATDVVLARIDTLACYIVANGNWGYTCYPTSSEKTRLSLGAIKPGTKVYATLERIALFPPNVAIKDEMNENLIFGYPPFNYPPSENSTDNRQGETEFDIDSGYNEIKKSKKDAAPVQLIVTPPRQEVYDVIPESIGHEDWVGYNDPFRSKPLLAIKFPSARSGVVTVSATYTKDFMKEDRIHTIEIKQGNNRVPYFVHDSIFKDNKKFRHSLSEERLIDTSQNYVVEESEFVAIAPPPLADDRREITLSNDPTYHKQITAVVGQKMFDVSEQINKGDNFLLVSSRRFVRGEYDVIVKMGDEVLYHQKRAVY